MRSPPPGAWCGPGWAARVLCVSYKTLLKWLADGRLRSARKWPGNHRLIRVADLVAFADDNGMSGLIDAAGLRGGNFRGENGEQGLYDGTSSE